MYISIYCIILWAIASTIKHARLSEVIGTVRYWNALCHSLSLLWNVLCHTLSFLVFNLKINRQSRKIRIIKFLWIIIYFTFFRLRFYLSNPNHDTIDNCCQSKDCSIIHTYSSNISFAYFVMLFVAFCSVCSRFYYNVYLIMAQLQRFTTAILLSSRKRNANIRAVIHKTVIV